MSEHDVKQAAQARRRRLLKEGVVRPGPYRHYGGAVCNVLCLAVRQGDWADVVVYEYPDTGNVWAHTLDDFLAEAPGGGPRFSPVPPSPAK